MDQEIPVLFWVTIVCSYGMLFNCNIKNAYALSSAHMILILLITLTIKTMYLEYKDGIECQKTHMHELAQGIVHAMQQCVDWISWFIWFFSFTWVQYIFGQKYFYVQGIIGLILRVLQLNLAKIGEQQYDAKTCIFNLLCLWILVCLLRFIPCWYLCIPWLSTQMNMLLNLNFICSANPEYEKRIFSFFPHSLSGNSSASQNGLQGLTAGKMEVEGYLLKYKVTEFKYINPNYNLNKPTTFIDIPWRKGSQDKTLVALLSKHVTYLDGQKITIENFGKFMEEKHKIYSKKTTSTFNPISAFAKEVLLQMKIAQAPK